MQLKTEDFILGNEELLHISTAGRNEVRVRF